MLAFVSGVVFFFKQKTAYEMRISDWSSDVCSSDLIEGVARTVDEPRQDIAADGVGAEHEFPASALHPYRRCQEVLAELLDRRVRRHQVGEDGEQHQDADDDQAGDGTVVLGKIVPELAHLLGADVALDGSGRESAVDGRHAVSFSAGGGCAG